MAKKSGLDQWIGAEGSAFVEVTIWVPSADRNGKLRLDQDVWKQKALQMFSRVFGKGATAMPQADGAWLNSETQQLVMEQPIMVFCYISEDQKSDAALMRQVGAFGAEMGKAMYQGEVAIRVGSYFFLINTF